MTVYTLLSTSLLAQKKTETLSNEGIISLTKAGMESGIILTKIGSSSCHFDVSTNALITLRKAGVEAAVLQAMMDKTDGRPIAKDNTQQISHTPAASSAPPPPAKPAEPKLDLINMVHLYDKASQTVRPLERATALLKTKSKFMGYGGTNMVLEISPSHSPVRIRLDSVRSFIVNTGSGTDGFALYKAEVKGNNRQGITAKFGMTGMKGSQGVMAVDMRPLGTGVYELIPNGTLEKGEYFFASRSAGSGATTNVDVYAFGVD